MRLAPNATRSKLPAATAAGNRGRIPRFEGVEEVVLGVRGVFEVAVIGVEEGAKSDAGWREGHLGRSLPVVALQPVAERIVARPGGEGPEDDDASC